MRNELLMDADFDDFYAMKSGAEGIAKEVLAGLQYIHDPIVKKHLFGLKNDKRFGCMTQPISLGIAKSEIVVLPNDGNHYGGIFGGALLSLMDRTAYIAARKYAQGDLVTVALDNVVFKNPVKVGDTAEISAHVSYVGKTSVEVCVGVMSEGKIAVQNAYFTYVNIDAKGKPIPVVQPSFADGEEKAEFERRAKNK